jgi:hypothetical protein
MLDLLSPLSKAKYLPGLALDVAYILSPSFYYGPARMDQLSDFHDKAVNLPMPTLVHNHRVLGLAVEGHEEQLVDYYQEVFRLMQHYGKQLPSCESYFWLRPMLLSEGEPCFTFPWCDTYPETATVLRALQDPVPDGILLHDIEQGWEGVIYAQGNRIYLAQGDGEQGEPYEFGYTDRTRLADLAATTLIRVQQQVSLFIRATGQNPWRA